MTITFCGHINACQSGELKRWLLPILKELASQGAHRFLLGGYGSFDFLAMRCVWELKKECPQIESVLVMPYENTKRGLGYYDSSICPVAGASTREAIPKRNRWMVDQSQVIVACTTRIDAASDAMLGYARETGRKIIKYMEQ